MYIIKPKKDLWVFGAWMGNKYSDNPKYLFEYVKIEHKNIKPIWITADKLICNNYDIIYRHTFKGMLYALRAEVLIVTHSTYCDLYYFINDNTRTVVQLWHGIPIKKIGFDDNLHSRKLKPARYYKEKYSLIIASSQSDKKNLMTAFSVDGNIVEVTGYPRNDHFINHKKVSNKYKILYAPTLRDKVNAKVNLFDTYKFDIKAIEIFLENNNIYLDIKMHPVNQIDPDFKKSFKGKRVHFIDSSVDVNEILEEYSLLISDYSGVYIDYLLLNRPIIFAPFDYEKYISKDRKLYYNYNDVSPGPHCKDWSSVLIEIKFFLNNPRAYELEREKMKYLFHKFKDANNCSRVYESILSKLQ